MNTLESNFFCLTKESQRFLLLQGPIGHFFKDLADYLMSKNKQVFKINFKYGDEYYYPSTDNPNNPYAYRDKLENFKEFLQKFVIENQIQAMICFGDNRPYHKLAKQVADEIGLSFWVFEEGYFRPHFVTLEKTGVNAFSVIPRDKSFFVEQIKNIDNQPVQPLKGKAAKFASMAVMATCDYLGTYFHQKDYPYYVPHKESNPWFYTYYWLKAAFKRPYYFIKDRLFGLKVKMGKLRNFYILPLQVYNDTQIKVHSDFNSVAECLAEILESFAQSASDDLKLVIKHHPMDRGFINYRSQIQAFIHKNPHLKGRIFYIHDLPLPILLRKGKGMVTINSTSGISALLHNMPTLVLGRANYDFAGLTHQGDLASFWNTPQMPDEMVFQAYRLYHLHKTQLQGSFYGKVIFDNEQIK